MWSLIPRRLSNVPAYLASSSSSSSSASAAAAAAARLHACPPPPPAACRRPWSTLAAGGPSSRPDGRASAPPSKARRGPKLRSCPTPSPKPKSKPKPKPKPKREPELRAQAQPAAALRRGNWARWAERDVDGQFLPLARRTARVPKAEAVADVEPEGDLPVLKDEAGDDDGQGRPAGPPARGERQRARVLEANRALRQAQLDEQIKLLLARLPPQPERIRTFKLFQTEYSRAGHDPSAGRAEGQTTRGLTAPAAWALLDDATKEKWRERALQPIADYNAAVRAAKAACPAHLLPPIVAYLSGASARRQEGPTAAARERAATSARLRSLADAPQRLPAVLGATVSPAAIKARKDGLVAWNAHVRVFRRLHPRRPGEGYRAWFGATATGASRSYQALKASRRSAERRRAEEERAREATEREAREAEKRRARRARTARPALAGVKSFAVEVDVRSRASAKAAPAPSEAATDDGRPEDGPAAAAVAGERI